MTRIAIGADHAGFELKQHLVGVLAGRGPRRLDHGTDSTERGRLPADLRGRRAQPCATATPRSASSSAAAARASSSRANKVRGVRAALCNDLYTARLARAHNDANVLSIGARVVGVGLAEEILATFLATAFEGGRHARRVGQITALEAEF